MASKKQTAAAARPTHLSVTAVRDGFRRAGRAWPARPTLVAVADLTAEQLEQLEAEAALDTPSLVVAPAVPPAPAAPEAAPAPEPA